MTFRFRADAMPLESAWTEQVSNTCGKCGGSVDPDEHADLEDLHDPECIGCPLCEVPLRLFRELPDGRVLGLALHWACFESMPEKGE